MNSPLERRCIQNKLSAISNEKLRTFYTDVDGNINHNIRQSLSALFTRSLENIFNSLKISVSKDDIYFGSVYTGSEGVYYAILLIIMKLHYCKKADDLIHLPNIQKYSSTLDDLEIHVTDELPLVLPKYLNSIDREFFYNGNFLLQSIQRFDVNSNRDRRISSSLLCGKAGVLFIFCMKYFILSEMSQSISVAPSSPENKNDFLSFLSRTGEYCALKRNAIQYNDSDEWLYGRAGFLFGLLQLKVLLEYKMQRLNGANDKNISLCLKNLEECISSVSNAVIKSGLHSMEQFIQERNGQNLCALIYKWQKKHYVGAAHGLIGILYIIIIALDHIKNLNPDITQIIQNSLTFLLNNSKAKNKNFYTSFDELNNSDLIHFCHGCSGAVFLFSKCYQIFKDEKWKAVALESGELIWNFGVLRKGPGLCHGISGNGYAFLCLYKLTNDTLWLNRAIHFALLIFDEEVLSNSRIPDNPYSLFEGISGASLYLLDLVLDPLNASFPLFEVITEFEKQ